MDDGEPDKSWWPVVKGKCKETARSVTVEPVIACYLVPIALTAFATDNINLEKACRVSLEYNQSVCDALTSRSLDGLGEAEDAVQRTVALMAVWRNVLRYSLPVVIVMFVGSWSDRRARRKPLLVAPLCGEFLTCLGLMLCAFYYLEWPLEAAGVVEGLFAAVTGGNMVMTTAVFSYVGDVTEPHLRTFRLGVVNAVIYTCVPLGTALSGVLLAHISFYGMFSAGAALYALGLLYVWLRVREPRPPHPRPPGVSFARDFFDWKLVVETFSVLFKKREGTRRLRLFLVLFALILLTGSNFGESSIGYLFLRRRLLWTEVNASYYSTYTILVNLCGTLVAVVLLSRVLGLEDSTIGIIACLSKIAALFIYAFSYQGWLFYLGQLVEMVSGAAVICVRAIASKAVPAEEMGRMFSLLAMSEVFAPLVFGSIYSALYAATLETFSGAVFLVGCVFVGAAALLLLFIAILLRREQAAAALAGVELQGSHHNRGFSDDGPPT